MISLRYFKSLSHKEGEYFHVPQVRSLDWDSGCRGVSQLSRQALGRKAASVTFTTLKGRVGKGEKEASVTTKSACKIEREKPSH